MKGKTENVFKDCESAGDFARRLDFLGVYLSPKRQRDLVEALTEQFEERFNTGMAVAKDEYSTAAYNSGYEDGYEEGKRWGAER